MRKILGLVLVAAFVVTAASSAFALSVGKSTFTAGVTITAGGSFEWTAAMNTGEGITWGENAQAGAGWVNASNWIVINATCTLGSIRLYTDNKNVNAGDYQYTGTLTENLGGLISSNNQSIAPLPMAWRMQTAAAGDANIPTNPTVTTGGAAAGAYASSYILDAQNSDFNTITPNADPALAKDNPEYSTIINPNGFKHSSGPGQRGENMGTFNLYFSADFSKAGRATYGTTITLEGIATE
ncbi:MAG: hypothetical protein LBR69_03260 [Endomicrobium sp.]|jgi:hypothetical protein|nr:hypothetical protein [Endomicrobium sp.]